MASNSLKVTFKRCTSAPECSDSDSLQTTTMSTQNTNPPREHTPTPPLNIFTPRARRHSASFSQLASGPRLTPRVSQLRQEECADIINSREATHEREIHTAMQISQSWEDLTIDAESWSFKGDSDLTNPLHVTLPTGPQSCSSPSPTSRTTMRLPYGLSPSPTRRTFATRRSMSPIAMRPSSLVPMKRKFEFDDNYGNTYSPPPFKKIFSERGNSPICQSPSLTCPSPDSTEGRTTPKLYVSKLYANSTNSSSSLSSSPSAPSPSMEIQIDLPSISNSEPLVTLPEELNDTQDGEINNKNGSIDDNTAKETIIATTIDRSNDIKLSEDFADTSNSNGSNIQLINIDEPCPEQEKDSIIVTNVDDKMIDINA